MKDARKVLLIVDDDPNDRYLMERTVKLLAPDLKVRTAQDGEDAIAYFDGKGDYANREHFPFPSFVFIDLKMPRVDGFAVLEHLKQHPSWAVIPVVVFSASCDLDDIQKAFLAGACAYHVKPSTCEEREALCKLLLSYWATCEVPQTDEQGRQLQTHSAGKLGERIPAAH